jgi:tetratricopeptide (TPR) repeat protein
MRSIVIYILFFAFASCSFSQNRKIDSLLSLVNKGWTDTTSAKNQLKLGYEFYKAGDKEKAIQRFKTSYAMAEKFKFERIELMALHFITAVFTETSQHDSAFRYSALYETAAMKYKNNRELWQAYMAHYNIFIGKGSANEAMEIILKAVRVAEKLNTSDLRAKSYKALGVTHAYLNDYVSAIKEYQRAQETWYASGDTLSGDAMLYVIGIAYGQMREPEKGLKALLKARDLCLRTNDEESLHRVNNELLSLYTYLGDRVRSLPLALESYTYFKKQNKKDDWANSGIKVMGLYQMMRRFSEAKPYIDEVYTMGSKDGNANWILASLNAYSTHYTETGDFKSACKYLIRLRAYKDSTQQVTYLQDVAEMSKKYESERKDKELLQKDSEIKIQQADAKHKSTQRNILMGGIGVLLLLVFFIFRSYNEKKKANHIISEQKKLVEEKQQEVMDSIRYAKRIQNAQIPNEKFIAKTLERLKSKNA